MASKVMAPPESSAGEELRVSGASPSTAVDLPEGTPKNSISRGRKPRLPGLLRSTSGMDTASLLHSIGHICHRAHLESSEGWEE